MRHRDPITLHLSPHGRQALEIVLEGFLDTAKTDPPDSPYLQAIVADFRLALAEILTQTECLGTPRPIAPRGQP